MGPGIIFTKEPTLKGVLGPGLIFTKEPTLQVVFAFKYYTTVDIDVHSYIYMIQNYLWLKNNNNTGL
jgi:hypothetical protein